ncbi:MAG: substrate-binding domain-containing protein [Propionibacteriaceae bacterium]|nr:substrate-binding domain-containing protein [Propionibacteriaceae bacterium]
MTTVWIDFEEIGSRAARLLLSQLEHGKTPMTSTGTPELIIRASSAPPR